MSILKVARMGHPVLRAEGAGARAAGRLKTARVQQLIDDMIETMVEYHGVGLAAPQVHEGAAHSSSPHLDARRGRGDGEPLAIINPRDRCRSATRSSRAGKAA